MSDNQKLTTFATLPDVQILSGRTKLVWHRFSIYNVSG